MQVQTSSTVVLDGALSEWNDRWCIHLPCEGGKYCQCLILFLSLSRAQPQMSSQGFTAHRNTDGATSFMVDKLHFPSKEEAQILRNEYFRKYHSTAKVCIFRIHGDTSYHIHRVLLSSHSKLMQNTNSLQQGLTVAEADGRLPPLPRGVTLPPGRSKRFDPEELDEYWATNLDFSLLGGPDKECIETFEAMSNGNYGQLNIVAFSNAPRKYVTRVLKEIGLDSYFTSDKLFGVNDVLPYCKPDNDSFGLVLSKVDAVPEECIMVEDSMKNIRAAKALGMRTILVKGRSGSRSNELVDKNTEDAEATKAGDAPDATDSAVDAVVEVASEIGAVLKSWMSE